MKGFNEEWLASHQAKGKFRPAIPVKPLDGIYLPPVIQLPPRPAPPGEPIVFRLIAPLPLLNVWERLHWRTRGAFKKALAVEIFAELAGRIPSRPIQRAEVTIWRHSIRTADEDNLLAKSLLDVLQPSSKRHPYGIGVIAGDDPAHVVTRFFQVKEKKREGQCTRVSIRDLGELI